MTNVGYTTVFEWLLQTKARINFLKGGANSSKSYSVAQHLLLNKFYKEKNKRILVVRKTTPAIKNSCWQLVTDLIKKYGLPYHPNLTDMRLIYRDNIMLFKGLDDPEKIKSSEYNYIWPEEATELSFADYVQLNLRMRRETDGINQMFPTFNPIDAQHWIKREVEDKPDEDIVIHNSTYKDNPYASAADIKILENLINQDENFYRVYTLNQWGILKNIIYDNYKVLTEPPAIGVKNIDYGIDWGFESPCALIRIYWLDGNKVIWEELIHRKGLIIPAFIEEAKRVLTGSEEDPEKKALLLKQEMQRGFYAGTDEPGSIQEFYNEGFNIHEAVTDVRDGINYCKAHLVGVIGSNLVKEIQGYKRMEDKNGNVKEEPVKFNDHGMDGGRYGTYSIGRNYMQDSKNVW